VGWLSLLSIAATNKFVMSLKILASQGISRSRSSILKVLHSRMAKAKAESSVERNGNLGANQELLEDT
jgi:hypothetical protein